MRSLLSFCLVALWITALHAAEPGAADPGPLTPVTLRDLRPHPRLLVGPDTWREIRQRAETDAAFHTLIECALATARGRIAAPPPKRVLTGKRLLFVSRRVLADAVWFSLAYQVTGERRFLEVAERNLLAAAAFDDWNPSHFLDVAEMSAAVALGYDWLYHDLSPASRAVLRRALVEKGVRPALDPTQEHNWWHTARMNWNQVCLGGLTLAALAIAEDEPELARRSLELLALRHDNGLAPYGPDGIYPEGPNYWRFGSSYTVLSLAALQSALGTEAPYRDLSAFLASARIQDQLIAPSGEVFSFGDGKSMAVPDPLLFWFAQRLKEPSLLANQGRHYPPHATHPNPDQFTFENIFAILCWQQPKRAAVNVWSSLFAKGQVPLAVFRGPDQPRGPFYLAVKGGSPGDSHGHMDSGSFILEINGVRWADDLGMQAYTALEAAGIKLFDARQDGDRWRIFRYTNFAHNTLTLGSALHRVEGRSTLGDFSAEPGTLGVTADLKPVLSGNLERALRRFQPHADGLGVDITDDLAGLAPKTEVTWTLVTSSTVTIDRDRALLSSGAHSVAVKLLDAPSGMKAELVSAAGTAAFDEPAPKHRILRFHIPVPADGRLLLKVRIEAVNDAPRS